MQTQHNLAEVLRVVESGQTVGITRRKHLVARIIPAQGPVIFPDFAERAAKIWNGHWRGTPSGKLLDESRGNR